MQIDLNADLGEDVGDDDALLAIVSSANIATGAHAGGGQTLVRVVAAAVDRGVAIGAHPSYRDRAGFGRASHLDQARRDPVARSHLVADLAEQVLLVAREAERKGAQLAHIKAHGSLYNEAVRDVQAAQILAESVGRVVQALGFPVPVMTQPGGELANVAESMGIQVIAEGFADRGYLGDGRLVTRGQPGDLHDQVEAMVAQALDLARGGVVAISGARIPMTVHSLCVHGDTRDAVSAARAIRIALEEGGWQVVADVPGRRVEPEHGSVPAGAPVIRDHAQRAPGAAAVAVAFGDRGLLVEPAAPRALRGASTAWVLGIARIARILWPEATVVPGLASVLIVFDRPADRPDRRAADDLLTRAASGDSPGLVDAGHDGSVALSAPGTAPRDAIRAPRTHEIRSRYDGPDLEAVAAGLGVTSGELVRRHCAARWTVAAVGFAPGFGYLTGSDPIFDAVARRADPRPRVPRGAVALAAGMCAVYPAPTPGGWQLIGNSDVVLFDPNAAQPALLRVGDRVRFTQVP